MILLNRTDIARATCPPSSKCWHPPVLPSRSPPAPAKLQPRLPLTAGSCHHRSPQPLPPDNHNRPLSTLVFPLSSSPFFFLSSHTIHPSIGTASHHCISSLHLSVCIASHHTTHLASRSPFHLSVRHPRSSPLPSSHHPQPCTPTPSPSPWPWPALPWLPSCKAHLRQAPPRLPPMSSGATVRLVLVPTAMTGLLVLVSVRMLTLRLLARSPRTLLPRRSAP